ncbi:MAG: hypothetical protein Q9190_005096 [Brigantiaea leucoxantha]
MMYVKIIFLQQEFINGSQDPVIAAYNLLRHISTDDFHLFAVLCQISKEELNIKRATINHVSTNGIDLEDSKSPICFIDILNESETDIGGDIAVLAVSRNGQARCFSADLSKELWSTDLLSSAEENVRDTILEYSIVVSREQAQKRLLANGGSSFAASDIDNASASSNVLLVLTRSTTPKSKNRSSLILQYYALRAANSEHTSHSLGTIPNIREIASVIIPEPEQFATSGSEYRLHPSNGTLYQGSPRFLAIFDLTRVVPRLVHLVVANTKDRISSWLRISPSIVGAASNNSLSLIDVRYSSLQAKKALNAQDMPKQEKQSNGENSVRLLTYYNMSDLIVALQGHRLITIQLSTLLIQSDGLRKRKRDGMLVDSIGHESVDNNLEMGLSRHPHGLPQLLQVPKMASSQWEMTRKQLDSLAAAGRHNEFDNEMALTLGILEDLAASRTRTPLPCLLGSNLPKVHYFLSKTFSIIKPLQSSQENSTKKQKIKLIFLSPKVFQSMSENGFMTVEHVEAAFNQYQPQGFTHNLEKTALLEALADSDRSLANLLTLLEGSSSLEATQLVHVLRIATYSLIQATTLDGKNLITTGETTKEYISDSEEKTELVGNQVDEASNDNSYRMRNAHAIIKLAIEMSSACPATKLTEALHKGLSKSDMRSLIDLLRTEMASNGWLSSYVEEAAPVEGAGLDSDDQLQLIARLLNCLIDSVGPGGWLFGSSIAEDPDEAADTIAYMREEVSAALEGIEEAMYLKGMLGEMLLCGKRSLGSHGQRPVAVKAPENGGALPLGLKLTFDIPLTKVGAGGELQQRTRRDIGQLKSRQVPKYSFERIRI